MVKDPVCKMEIEQSAAVTSTDYEGTSYYFCSEACCRQFVSDPQRFLAD